MGKQVLLVTSGAIAAGVEALGMGSRPTDIPQLQAAASVGQGLLVNHYAGLFAAEGVAVGQVLLTQHDIIHRQQYLNARNTLEALLKLGAVPVINENDTTAVDEIRFGDNDTLAALIAHIAKAGLLILLSDIDGLMTGDPKTGEARLIPEVRKITAEVEAAAGGVGTKFASGGMVTKIQAAKIVTLSGAAMIIANGRTPGVLADIASGKSVGTYFHPTTKKVSGRKLWIVGRPASGRIKVDDGARKALMEMGKSLLPAGVVGCSGSFEAGDSVDIEDAARGTIARGLTNLSAKELKLVRGLKSSEVAKVLPEAEIEVIHRDSLVVFD